VLLLQKYYAAKKKRQMQEAEAKQSKDKKQRPNDGHDVSDFVPFLISG
jgi:hypothetical protein